MAVNYKKLWELLIYKDMKKQNLHSAVKVSAVTIAQYGRNENAKTAILSKTYSALNCNVGDIIDIVDESTHKGIETEESLHDK